MTWLDVSLFVVLVLFLAVGARMGSVWMAACLAGGFFGAFLTDMYALSLATSLAHFPGSVALAGAALFILGAGAILLPGLFLSGLFEGMILGVIDSSFGLFTGAVAAAVLIANFLLIAVPFLPNLEASRAWKKSVVVRPLQRKLEDTFQRPVFRRRLSGLGAARSALNELEPLTDKAKTELKEAAHKAVEKAKG